MKTGALNYSQNLIRPRDLIPGLASMMLRLPSLIRSFKSLMKLKENDRIGLGWKLESNAQLYPNKNAILSHDGNLTHGELNEAVNRHCHHFLSSGIKKGDSVVVMLENRPSFFVLIGALAKIGATATLINTNQRGSVLSHSLNLNKASSFLIGEELVKEFEAVKSDLKLDGNEIFYYVSDKGQSTKPKGFVNISEVVKNQSVENPSTTREIMLKDSLCHIFTSGTTGLPKAAKLKNRRWIGTMYSIGGLVMNLKPNDVLYCPLPLFHSTAFCMGWAVAAYSGSAIAIRRKFSVSEFWKDVEKFKATAFVYIGELCRYLLNQPTRPEDKKNPIKKCLGVGLRPDIWKKFKYRFGIKQICELYSASEYEFAFFNLLNINNTVGICFTPFAIVKYDNEAELPILDENGFMQRVETGEKGLLLAGITKSLPFYGYSNDEATENKVFRNVFNSDDIWLNTGDFVCDLGCRHIQFADRLGDTFRWKGENVSSLEVEEIINKRSDVSQASVYGVQIPGTDGKAGMAGLVLTEPIAEFDLKALAAHLHESLPSYAIPKFIRFKAKFETTPTFKVKKTVLRDDGFDPNINDEPVFALLPGTEEYVPMKLGLYKEIIEGKFRY